MLALPVYRMMSCAALAHARAGPFTVRETILFQGTRHPAEMGAAEVTRFLTSLAVEGNVAASTQNQALSALLFLYREVLEQDLPWLDNVVRAKGAQRLPVVLTRADVRAVIQELQGTPRPMALLMYGAGLRLLECAPVTGPGRRLRVQSHRGPRGLG